LQIDILKCHGSGNDFILIDEYSNNYDFTDRMRTLLTKQLCDRSSAVGADGILFVQKSDVADAKMRIFNSDGSEPEMCGNGLRCAGRYVMEMLNKDEVIIETLKANLNVTKVEDIYEDVITIEVAIGPVSFDLDALPLVRDGADTLINTEILELSERLKFTAISIPNPHVITLVENVTREEVERIGKMANENKTVFPKGVNVSFVKLLENSSIFVQTFERGVGITNACGTAMSASSLVTCLLGMNEINSEITVLNTGGFVKCIVNKEDGRYEVQLRGNATYEFESSISFDLSSPEDFEQIEGTVFEDEAANYTKLREYAKNLITTTNK
jgi:diaminopimelate epimerase